MKRYIKKFIKHQNSLEVAQVPLWKWLLIIIAIGGLCSYLTAKWNGKTMFTVVQNVEAPLATCQTSNFFLGARVRHGENDYLVTRVYEYESWGELDIDMKKVDN